MVSAEQKEYAEAFAQAALAAIANAEGAKIQRMVAMPGVTPEELLCLNKSVAEMMDSMTMLEAVMKQKMGVFSSGKMNFFMIQYSQSGIITCYTQCLRLFHKQKLKKYTAIQQ